MVETVGIDAIKAVVKILIDIGEGIQEKFEDDGKIKFVEAAVLAVSLFPDIYTTVRRGQEIKAQWKDFSDEEKLEIATYVAEELKLKNEEIEEKVESAFELLMAIDSFLRSFKKEEVEEPVE